VKDHERRQEVTADEGMEALREEVLRLRATYRDDVWRGYEIWKRRLDDLMGHTAERNIAHSRLLALYETVAADA
jgi:hypothetical protein